MTNVPTQRSANAAQRPENVDSREIRVLVSDSANGRELIDMLDRRPVSRILLRRFRSVADVVDVISAEGPAAESLEDLDVVVLDVDSNEGWDQLAADLVLLQTHTAAAVVVVSSHPSLSLATKAIRAGANDFIVPHEMSALSIERALLLSAVRNQRDYGENTKPERAIDDDFSLAIAGASDGLWIWNLGDGTLKVSGDWRAIVQGSTAADSSGQAKPAVSVHSEEASLWFDRIHPEDRDRFRRDLQLHLRSESSQLVSQHRLRVDDGSYRWVLCRGKAAHTGLDSANSERWTHVAGSLEDITDRKLEEQRLELAAHHDPLTGLPNRSLFLERVDRCIRRGEQRSDYRFAVLFLDLDRFKTINDSLGHAVGDRLLVSAGERLEELLRPSDWVARIGGDEFAILADDLSEPADATRVAQRVLQKLALPHSIDSREVYTTASIGVTLSGPLYKQAEAMLRDADNAMYRAKSLGRARYQLFDPQMHESAMKQLALENDLRRALGQDELSLRYQPIVRLDNGVIEGFEALVRWEHPERGTLGPDEFINIAEETGAIHQIGRWVLDGACRQAASWQQRFPRPSPLTMSVNISGREFLKEDLVPRVTQSIKTASMAPGSLRLELTETALMERPEVASRRIEELKRHAVRLHLDDFGTGYCSLSYLQKLPTDTLKIDRSFISQINEAGLAGHIVETIVDLAHRLGIGVLAEGLETEAQVSALRNLACNYGQGFYFSEAVVPGDAEAMLTLGRLTGPN